MKLGRWSISWSGLWERFGLKRKSEVEVKVEDTKTGQGARPKVTAGDYETVKILAYARQDAIVGALIRAGISPWDSLTLVAMGYHIAQVGGMQEARKIAEELATKEVM